MPDDKRRSAEEQRLQAEAPTYYANQLSVGISAYDVGLMFGRQVGGEPEPQVRIIMSLEHAIVMTMVLRRVLREHAKRTGITPAVPVEVMRDLQLDEEQPLW